MEIVLQSSTYSSRGGGRGRTKRGGEESEGHDWGWHDPSEARRKEEEGEDLGLALPLPSSSGADLLWYTQYDLYGAGFD